LFIAGFFERNSILINTLAFSEKEAADVFSADQHLSSEPGVQDQKTYYVPGRFYMLRQVLRFGLAGGLNTLVDVLTLNGLLWLFPPTSTLLLLSYNVLAYSLGAVNSFLLNKYWTFRQKQQTTRRELARFTLVTLCGIGWSTIILWLASKVLHPLLVNPTLWANASKVVAIAGTALISYLGMRLWVFVSKRPKKQALLYRALSAAENAGSAEHLLSMMVVRIGREQLLPRLPRPAPRSISSLIPSTRDMAEPWPAASPQQRRNSPFSWTPMVNSTFVTCCGFSSSSTNMTQSSAIV
jgi:putative flippase GtrA